MTDLTALIVIAKAILAPAGAGITYFAYRAYRRTRSTAMRSFVSGFAALTAGTLLAGGVGPLVGSAGLGRLLGNGLTAAGFLFLVHSLYVQDTRLCAPDAGQSSTEG